MPDAPHPRIVCYAPALTDMMFQLGLGDHVVGVTKWCMPPEPRPVLGELKVNAEEILSVEPDIILIQQDESQFAGVKRLRPQVRIEHFRVETIGDIAATIQRLAELAGKPEVGVRKRAEFEAGLAQVRHSVSGLPALKVLFIMGYERPMCAGKNTFMNDMIQAVGAVNVAAAHGYSGYTAIDREILQEMAPDVIICYLEEGREAGAKEYFQKLKDVPAVRDGKVRFVGDRRWTIWSYTGERLPVLAELVHGKTPGDKPATSAPAP